MSEPNFDEEAKHITEILDDAAESLRWAIKAATERAYRAGLEDAAKICDSVEGWNASHLAAAIRTRAQAIKQEDVG